MKFCKLCGFERPEEDFPTSNKSNGKTRFLCKDHWKEYCRKQGLKFREKNPNYEKERYRKNPEIAKERAKKSFKEKRILCLKHYSGDFPKCECCGEDRIEFLAMDHVDGGGTKHKRQLQEDGSNLYRWLIENNFPKGFRVLCHNCNSSLGYYGYCPHKKNEDKN